MRRSSLERLEGPSGAVSREERRAVGGGTREAEGKYVALDC